MKDESDEALEILENQNKQLKKELRRRLEQLSLLEKEDKRLSDEIEELSRHDAVKSTSLRE